MDVVEIRAPLRILAYIDAGKPQQVATIFRNQNALVLCRLRQPACPQLSSVGFEIASKVLITERTSIRIPPAGGMQSGDSGAIG